MTVEFDEETLERLRRLPRPAAFDAARAALWGCGPVGSEDFLEAYAQLVEQGILSWDEIDQFEQRC